jgi:hypothetical protein
MSGGLKVASFTVHATAEQSARWKRAAEAEGHRAAGTWLAAAADAYLKARARAGAPVPLAWHRGAFRVTLEGGEVRVNGHVSPPFGSFAGTQEGPAAYAGRRRHVLVYLPAGRVIATLRSFAHCKGLAAELARVWVRWNGEGGREPPPSDTGPLLERFRREDV